MFLNYLKIAFRTLRKYKSFSFINILGLAIGMPVCLLTILVIRGQHDLDQFHANKDRIYRLTATVTNKEYGVVNDFASAPAPISPVLVSELAEVEDAVRLHGFYSAAKYGEKLLTVEGFYAEQSYFHIFSFPLLFGNRQTALQEPFSAVISEDLSKRFFGDENPIGRILSLSFGDVQVTGVQEDLAPGQTTHLRRDMLVSFSTLHALRESALDAANPESWDQHGTFYHYLLLAHGAYAGAVEKILPTIVERFSRDDAPYAYQFQLQPLTGIALGPELVNQIGNVMEGTVLYIFLIISVIIMAPVVFNYVSLTVARSLKRAKEMGVRKVVGAQQRHIMGQIMFESIMVAALALLPAAVFLDLLLPMFNDFQFVEYIAIDWKSDWGVYVFFIIFSLGVGTVAGIIPALVLSKVNPSSALKGFSRLRGYSGLTLRKIFLVIQFTLSIFFIVLTTLFHRQFDFMLTANYGFDKEHVVGVDLQDVSYELFRNELSRRAGIVDISAASHLIGRVNARPDLSMQSAYLNEPIKAVSFSISENHLDNLKFTTLAGRSFSAQYGTDSTQSVIVNQTAVQRLGFAHPAEAIGQRITLGDDGLSMFIVGVTNDFHYSRLQNIIDPVVLRYSPEQYHYAMVKIAPGEMTNAVASMENVWGALSVDLKPLQYLFMDDYITGAYNDMREIMVFLSIIAGLAISIACLGLLGMAIFNTETRIKEIGIRKVFGASAFDVVVLLSQDLVKLFMFAVAIVTPLLWAFMNFMFFERVAYRVELDASIFVPGLLLVLVLAFLSIGSQTLRAANENPTTTLRYE